VTLLKRRVLAAPLPTLPTLVPPERFAQFALTAEPPLVLAVASYVVLAASVPPVTVSITESFAGTATV
jgi:hypothetical protein